MKVKLPRAVPPMGAVAATRREAPWRAGLHSSPCPPSSHGGSSAAQSEPWRPGLSQRGREKSGVSERRKASAPGTGSPRTCRSALSPATQRGKEASPQLPGESLPGESGSAVSEAPPRAPALRLSSPFQLCSMSRLASPHGPPKCRGLCPSSTASVRRSLNGLNDMPVLASALAKSTVPSPACFGPHVRSAAPWGAASAPEGVSSGAGAAARRRSTSCCPSRRACARASSRWSESCSLSERASVRATWHSRVVSPTNAWSSVYR
mmetsp:Transcript_30480/g.90455  ORF Transcript_30480/g.90455 Transcript_30480/m.90455 type:complete len:264 (+) Transcript_30480:1021-1812(+)